MSKTYLIALGICLVIGGFIGYSIKPDKDCPEPNTLVEYRYLERVDTLIVPKFKTIIRTDTLKYRDTLFIHNETNYIAEIDTAYEDSSLTAKVQYVSDIPLSKKSYFNLDFKVREKIITKTIIQTEAAGFFYKRFIPYIGVGLGYNGKTIEPNLQIGFGIRIN